MPNQQNIEAPITLVSPARSGTTLVGSIFIHHPDCRSCHETGDLVFGSWYAVESSPGTPNLFGDEHIVSNQERAARVVRQTFLTCFPDDQPRWFHKPIRVPMILKTRFSDEQWSEAAEWYWEVMTHSFPQAKFFTVLRHPCDIVLSHIVRSGPVPKTVWKELGLMAYILTHRTSPVEYAVHYEMLVQNKNQIVKELLEFADLAYVSQVLDVFNTVHEPSPDRTTLKQISATRRNEWDQLDPADVHVTYIEYLTRLFKKFGYDLPLPSHFTEDRLLTDRNKPPKESPQEIIARLRKEIKDVHRRSEARALARENVIREFRGVNRKLRMQIAELEHQLNVINQTPTRKLIRKYRSLKERAFGACKDRHNAK